MLRQHIYLDFDLLDASQYLKRACDDLSSYRDNFAGAITEARRVYLVCMGS